MNIIKLIKHKNYRKYRERPLSLFLAFMLFLGTMVFFVPNTIVSAAETSVNTLSALRSALETTGEQTIIITGNITINSGYMIEIPSGAKITLKANGPYTLNASGGNFTSGAIQLKSGAQLIIDGSETITFTNASGNFFDVRGTLTMNGGLFTGNQGSDGGAIYVGNAGNFIMNSGTISGNGKSGTYGGGVHIAANGSFTMNGGTISNNTASTGGGVHTWGVLTMYGGAISGNTAGEGGGIYIDTKGKITLFAGDLYNNTATSTYGGAIGTGTTPQSAGNTVHNAVIVGNTANKGDARGGGIWGCPAGKITFENESVIIGGNSATKRGAQICIESSSKPAIPTKMIGGVPYEWYWDIETKRYPAVSTPFVNGATPSGYEGYDISLSNSLTVTVSDINSLKAKFPGGKVFIYNNTAACGGGVGGNGSISFVADEVPPPDSNKLIVHKYLMADVNSAGPRGNGTELNASQLPAGASPLEGITFHLYLIDLSSHDGKAPDYADYALDDKYTPTKLYSPENDTANYYPLSFIAAEITNTSGLAVFDGLDDGLYLIVEQQSPHTSVIAPSIVPLPLRNEDNNEMMQTVHIYPKNERTMPAAAKIVILKVSEKNHSQTLPGASFKISLENTGNVGTFVRKDTTGKILYPGDAGYGAANDWEITTKSDGIAEFLGIKYYTGTHPVVYLKYYIFETNAPSGFNKLTEPVEVDFGNQAYYDEDFGGYIISETVYNNVGIMFPETGGTGTFALILAGFILTVSSLISLTVLRRYIKLQYQRNK